MSSRVNDAAKSFTDLAALNDVKKLGRNQNPEAIMEVARQFESFFITQLMKEMRAGVDLIGKDNFTNSSEMKFHQQMFDQQISLEVANKGGYGLAEIMARQLTEQFDINWDSLENNTPDNKTLLAEVDAADKSLQRRSTPPPSSTIETMGGAQTTATATVPSSVSKVGDSDQAKSEIDAGSLGQTIEQIARFLKPLTGKAADMAKDVIESGVELVEQLQINKGNFFAELKDFAANAAEKLGVDKNVLLAQAALETGWGEFISKGDSGSSKNLFNIKSSSQWTGDSVKVTTVEYRDGVAQKEQANFRAYSSFEDSFDDYADFILSNPRYEKALSCASDSEAYLRELQQAGYATDPNYADKIMQLLQQPEFK
ncbi:flagellar assembly peptidoglycan hydrolase FlgJ [Halioxenophilus aromaticivorans]